MTTEQSSSICDFLPQIIPDRGETEIENHIENVVNPPPQQGFNQEITAPDSNKLSTKGFNINSLTSYMTEGNMRFVAIVVAIFTVMQMSVVRTTLMNLAPLILRSNAMTVNVTISIISAILIIIAKKMLN